MNHIKDTSDVPEEVVSLCYNLSFEHYERLLNIFGNSHHGLNCTLNSVIHTLTVLIHRNNPEDSIDELCETIKQCLKNNLKQQYTQDKHDVGLKR